MTDQANNLLNALRLALPDTDVTAVRAQDATGVEGTEIRVTREGAAWDSTPSDRQVSPGRNYLDVYMVTTTYSVGVYCRAPVVADGDFVTTEAETLADRALGALPPIWQNGHGHATTLEVQSVSAPSFDGAATEGIVSVIIEIEISSYRVIE